MPLQTYSDGQTITHTIINDNFALTVLTDTAKTISVTHTWSQTQTFTGGFTAAAACTLSGGLSMNGSAISAASTIEATSTITASATGTSLAASGDISVVATKKLAMNVGKTTYIAESAAQTVSISTNSAEIAKFTNGTGGSADDMGCFLWDVSAASLKRVSRGAADSGAAGYRLLRVTN